MLKVSQELLHNFLQYNFLKNSLGTTTPRILKFCTNIGYDLLYHVRISILIVIIPLICLFFFFSNNSFMSKISQELLHLGF